MILRLFFACLLLTGLARAEEKRIAVFVGLCDNATQGIVKVGAKIGDGNKPEELCCLSGRYFRERLETAGVRPVLLTTQLMYPGSFVLHDALEPWLAGKDRQALRTAAGAAYARNQKIKTAAATGVFSVIAP